jgi:hypothetical protein
VEKQDNKNDKDCSTSSLRINLKPSFFSAKFSFFSLQNNDETADITKVHDAASPKSEITAHYPHTEKEKKLLRERLKFKKCRT